MKSNFKLTSKKPKGWAKGSAAGALFALGAAVAVFWGVLPGCTNKIPFDAAGYPGLTPTPSVTPVYEAPTMAPNRALVVNFDNNTAAINPQLMEMNNAAGGYILKTSGTVTAVNNFTSNILLSFTGVTAGGANGTPYAFNVQGTLIDAGNGSYPAIELEAMMENGNEYDGSFFSGVQFYLKIASDDSTTKRDFSIPVYQTQGTPQGGCVGAAAGGCYDNFAFDLSSGTAGQWKSINIPFSSLAQAYVGVKTAPNPNFAGQNLQQMLWLQWEESRNNSPGTSHIDYWVDNVSFE